MQVAPAVSEVKFITVTERELSDILDDEFGNTPRYGVVAERSDDDTLPRGSYVGSLEMVDGDGEVILVDALDHLKARILKAAKDVSA